MIACFGFSSFPGAKTLIGSLALVTCLGTAGTAMAGSYRHHRQAAPKEFNALVGSGGFVAPAGAAMGSWRYGLTKGRGGCDRNYPMHESSPCGSLTGGPVGGMGS